MSTEMMLNQANLPAHLQNTQASTDEFAGGLQSGALLPVMSIRGKEFRLRWQGVERPLTQERHIDAVFVAARPHISKRFYNKGFESGSVDAPTCASTDGVRPDSGSEKQCDTCAMCPHNQFGSRITPNGKKGKACNDYKRIIVLPLVQGNPLSSPVVLDVPATSLKAPQAHRGEELFLREYMGLLARHNVPAQGVVTRISFTSAEYPQLHMALQEYTEERLYQHVMELRGSDEVTETLQASMAEPTGPIKVEQEPAAPAPEAKPEPKPEPKPAPAPVQEAPKPEPVQEAAPEPEAKPEAQPEQNDDGLMNEINDLLKGI